MDFAWMAWTWQTAVFFAAIALILTTMTVWQAVWPADERVGILRIPTTRGDRLFLTLLGAAYIHLVWLGVLGADYVWGATLASLVWCLAVFRWV